MATPPLADCDLSGLGVLVTRAVHQAGPLCELIRSHGGRPIPFPAIEIGDPADLQSVQALLSTLPSFDIAIFISPNAVAHGLALLGERGIPSGLKIAAVGKGTARALGEAGLEVNVVPEHRFDSEALLASNELQQIAGRRVIIFRGDGGRPLLGDTLKERGAEVVYAEVYRRVCPKINQQALSALWLEEVQIVTATSNDILNNLVRMMGSQGVGYLRRTPLVVISQRMRERALELGCQKVLLAKKADDMALLEAVCAYKNEKV